MGRFIKHVGIIMDGNGRWAQMRGLPRYEGHKRGVEKVQFFISFPLNIKNGQIYKTCWNNNGW